MDNKELKNLGLQIVKNVEVLLSDLIDIYDFLEGVQDFVMEMTDNELLPSDDRDTDGRKNE